MASESARGRNPLRISLAFLFSTSERTRLVDGISGSKPRESRLTSLETRRWKMMVERIGLRLDTPTMLPLNPQNFRSYPEIVTIARLINWKQLRESDTTIDFLTFQICFKINKLFASIKLLKQCKMIFIFQILLYQQLII